jgi:Rps23 Pro-64 3,4-dihydroxylase Tpa1-like proline 4-hydroxylase
MESSLPSSQVSQIKVNVLLNGGHSCTLHTQSDSALLQQLFQVLLARGQQQTVSGVFQISVEEGRAALCFPAEHLVGLVTDPPVQLEQIELPQPSQPHQTPSQLPANFVASLSIQLDEFLTLDEQTYLLASVLEQMPNFSSSTTSTGDQQYRQSRVLHALPDVFELMRQRIRDVMPKICQQLRLPSFPVADVEAQLTAHNHGDFYKVHNDSGSPDTATRVLTYVYYFYREPKAFTGGELKIYDSRIENNMYVQAESSHLVEPRNNSIVFFPSYCLHEVLPIECPSQTFADSRFTINGWVRRAS